MNKNEGVLLTTGEKIELPKPNWKLFENLIKAMPVQQMNMEDVVRRLFEQTSSFYLLKYLEEKSLVQKYETKIVSKTSENNDLWTAIKLIQEAANDSGTHLPEEATKILEKYSK